jgi:integrase
MESMATLTTDKAGNRNIRFTDPSGLRKCLYLGRMSLKSCQRIQTHIERLASAAISGEPVTDDTGRWLADQDAVMRGKLARVGLVKARGSVTVGEFIDEYINGRHDAKASTKVNWRKVKRQLLERIDGGRPLASITKTEAKDFRQSLIAAGYADNTTRKVCSVVRQFFTDAVERGYITSNPFDQKSIPTSTGSNPERQAYVSVETAEAVLNACPDAEWRLLFALSRFAGLRCPSEHLALRWEDVNWERSRMTVRSSKTEHHEGGAMRVVPIFSRLRPYLEEAYELNGEKSEFVIARYRDTNANLRTRLLKIINRAGETPWPKLFNNLRSSCETDLVRCHPIRAVCSWIGHSLKVAHQHYLQTVDADFDRAAGLLPQSMPVDDCQPVSRAASQNERYGKTLEPSVLPSRTVTEAGLEPSSATVLSDNDLRHSSISQLPESMPLWVKMPPEVWARLSESAREEITGISPPCDNVTT